MIDEIIYIAGEPYTREDAFARSGTDEYVYTEELSAYIASRYDLDERADDIT